MICWCATAATRWRRAVDRSWRSSIEFEERINAYARQRLLPEEELVPRIEVDAELDAGGDHARACRRDRVDGAVRRRATPSRCS